MNGAPWIAALATGFALGATLIIAIGAQNAFVLRQGLRREHVGAVVLFCATADALLMAGGVAGIGTLLGAWPSLRTVLTIAGALFLAVYGLRALHKAWRPAGLDAGTGRRLTLGAAVSQAAAFTLLNPHVYLDTVLLVGSMGNAQPMAVRGWFLFGAVTASAVWFTTLGYGAGLLAPWFARPAAWRVLDAGVGITMLVLAGLLTVRLDLAAVAPGV